jgi:hypothetical protein
MAVKMVFGPELAKSIMTAVVMRFHFSLEMLSEN